MSKTPPAFQKLSLLAILSLLSIEGNTQSDWCGSDEHRREKIKEIGRERWKAHREKVLTQAQGRSGHTDTIPVVVHVIHDGGKGDLGYDQIKDGIRVLNEDFNRRNPDTTETRSPFDSIAASSKIVFKLARYGPDGNCTNGVTRTPSELTYNADNAVKDLVRWPNESYLNIWVANSLENWGQNTLLGYAEFPWGGLSNDYGIVMRNDRFGTIGTSSSEGRTTTHEVGHCLGLLHTFQDGCGGDCSSNGDKICDTPPAKEETYGCDKNQNSCSSDTIGPSPYNSDVVDQIENFMSYDNCQNMFSTGQKKVMKGALNNVQGLKELTSSKNLEETGVHRKPLCKVRFSADRKIVCTGDSVHFEGHSYHGIEERTWTFHKGSPFFAINEREPAVSYDQPGLYDVELKVGQGKDSSSLKKEDLIRVLDDQGVKTPYKEDMENGPVKSTAIIPGSGLNGTKWAHTDQTGASGHSSLLLENYYANKDQSYRFETQTIDASATDPVALSFKVAYRKSNSSDNGILKVYASKKCSDIWDLRGSFSSDQLSNKGPKNAYYKNPASSDWKTFRIEQPLANGYDVEGLRFKFEFLSGGGNNVYIDDINVTDASTLSVQKGTEPPFQVTLHPNPASERVQVRLKSNDRIEHRLKDASGRTVKTGVLKGKGDSHEHRISIENLSSGLYFMHFKGEEGNEEVRKLMIR